MTTLEQFAFDLMAAQRRRRRQRRTRPWQPSMTPATSLGYECERRSVYQQTQPHKADPVNDELASIFEEGDLHQKDVRAELLDLGYEVVEAEVNFKDIKLQISGTIDGKIAVDDPSAHHGQRRITCEIKSTSKKPPTTEREIRESETALLRRYYAQMQIYLYLVSESEGLFIFKEKNTGLWTVVPVTLDYDYAEKLLQRAERIRDAVAAVRDIGDYHLPERIPDRSECPGCPFRDTVCHPGQAEVDPMLLVDDHNLLAQLFERESAKPHRDSFEKVDKAIKQRFKLTKGERFIVGDRFLVTKKVTSTQTRFKFTRFEAPERSV